MSRKPDNLPADEAQLRQILDSVPAIIAYVDASETYRFANHAYQSLFGLDPAQMIGRTMHDVLGEKYSEAKPHIEATLAGRRTMHDRVVTANERSRYLHNVYVPHLAADGSVLGMVILAVDISDRKALEQELVRRAQHDPLTGLLNRGAFEDQLQQALGSVSPAGAGLVGLLYVDIDRFKSINDALGHQVGDVVLRSFAARLRQCVRSIDTVARMGGDEFVVLLEHLTRADDAARIASKIVDAMREKFDVNGALVTATASVGVATCEAQGDAAALSARADAALYAAKDSGRNAYRVA
ncbi:MAG TPA: diguanylate cyclase [Burkholderiales bacterium]|nr:diguanylate cyclase [Burkholderiales bacterium]